MAKRPAVSSTALVAGVTLGSLWLVGASSATAARNRPAGGGASSTAVRPQARTTDNVGTDTSEVLYGGQPHVWYDDLTAGSLRHGWWDGSRWNFNTLDGPGSGSGGGRTTDNVGSSKSALLYGGQPHVWYYDTSVGSLRHGWWDGTRWNFETLDGP